MTDYPTEEELEKIRRWPGKDYHDWMAFIRSLWTYADCGYWKQEENTYDISTGGWSGNEEIIAAMQDNFVLWSMYWCQSRRGGHYVFASCRDWLAIPSPRRDT